MAWGAMRPVKLSSPVQSQSSIPVFTSRWKHQGRNARAMLGQLECGNVNLPIFIGKDINQVKDYRKLYKIRSCAS